MEEPLNICVKKTVVYAEGSERARYLGNPGRWFAGFCNRGVDKEYQGLPTLAENHPYFQVRPHFCAAMNMPWFSYGSRVDNLDGSLIRYMNK